MYEVISLMGGLVLASSRTRSIGRAIFGVDNV